MLSCEFCEISKNTFFHRTSLVAASGIPLANCVVWPIAGLNGIGFNALNILSCSKIYHSKESQTKENNTKEIPSNKKCPLYKTYKKFLKINKPFPSRAFLENCTEIKIKLNFYFHTSLWCWKCFIKAFFIKVFKALLKPFEAPQRSVKIKS